MLSWRLSNTLDARFCTEALTEALERCGRPEIFNSDQGSRFTSLEFTSVLKNSGVAISTDGTGRCLDNIFIERLWRSLKYEAVCLHKLSDGFHAQQVISLWMELYNTQRPHSALRGSSPKEDLPTTTPQDRASDLARPSANSTGARRRVKQDPGRMIYCTGIHLISAAYLSYEVGPPQLPGKS